MPSEVVVLENEKIENEKIDITIWKNFLELVKNHKRDFILLAIIMVFVGALDSVFPLFTKYAIDNFIVEENLIGYSKTSFYRRKKSNRIK